MRSDPNRVRFCGGRRWGASVTMGREVPELRLRRLVGRPEAPPRVSIVQTQLDRFRSPSYLEIGVNFGALFLNLRAGRRVGVDPSPQIPAIKRLLHPSTFPGSHLIRNTSDDYFAELNPTSTFDVVFIDGYHSYEQSLRDVENALRHLSTDGVILLHDCSPQTEAMGSATPFDMPGHEDTGWCGEVWKTIVHLRATRDDLITDVLDVDYGIGRVRRGRSTPLDISLQEVVALRHEDLDANRKVLLGLTPSPGSADRGRGAGPGFQSTARRRRTGAASFAAARRHLPAGIKRVASRGLELVDPIMTRRVRSGSSAPLPPRRLRARVGEPDAQSFAKSGEHVAREVAEILAAAGRPLHGFSSIWDLGAGSGRVVTRLPVSPAARLVASDVDLEACRWLATHHPRIEARAVQSEPPSPFPTDSFDLVIAISVFTHLDEAGGDRWLSEIARVLQPGGLALLTTMGEQLLETYRLGRRPGMSRAQRALADQGLHPDRLLFAEEPRSQESARRSPGVASRYGLTFHHPDYVRSHWSRWLDVRAVVPGSLNWRQDAVLCSKPAAAGSTKSPSA